MMRFKFLLIACLALTQLRAQVETRTYYADKGLVPREHALDFKHLKLDVRFEPEKGKVIGKVKHQFVTLQKGVDSIYLDAINMSFSRVELDGQAVDFKTQKKGIVLILDNALDWDSEHELEMDYTAFPKKGIYFIGWNDPNGLSRKQIWTQGQGINNRHWIPMFDEKNDKVISEVVVHFDQTYKVLSNGKKLSEKVQKDGTKRWHYKISHPHAPYLIMLGIGDYAIYETKSSSGVPMNLYYYPDQEDQRAATYKFSKQMFNFFEKEIGVPYPWESYSQIPVQDFMYGAMENTTATVFGDFYLVNERAYLDKNYVRVDAHELAHQWFGDMITARASADHWLQESFATHYDMMYQQEAFGKEYFDWVRRDYNDQAIAASKKDLKPVAHSSAGVVRHYPKGAFVLQMLKYVVGREEFNAAIKYYLEKHAYQNVNSDDLLSAFHERLGLSLNWFWEQWVYKGGEPEYKVEFEELDGIGRFKVQQTHERSELNGLFKMPINLQVIYQDGSSTLKKVWVEKESQEFDLELHKDKSVAFVLFDPNSEVMKSIEFKKPLEMLKLQAQKAEHMLDRYDAIVALSEFDFDNKEAFLTERFKAEQFHAIKGEIIKQLLPQLNEASEQLTVLGLQDKDVNVRKAVLDNTIRISSDQESLYRSLLKDSSYIVIEKALDLLAFYYPQNIDAYLQLTKEEFGNRSHNVRIAHLKYAIEIKNDEKALEELIEYASLSYEFTTRVNAFETLKELNVINVKGLAYLFDASFSFNSRLAGPARKSIDHFFAQSHYKRLIVDYVSKEEWSDLEFRKVSKYLIP